MNRRMRGKERDENMTDIVATKLDGKKTYAVQHGIRSGHMVFVMNGEVCIARVSRHPCGEVVISVNPMVAIIPETWDALGSFQASFDIDVARSIKNSGSYFKLTAMTATKPSNASRRMG